MYLFMHYFNVDNVIFLEAVILSVSPLRIYFYSFMPLSYSGNNNNNNLTMSYSGMSNLSHSQ